MSCGCIRVLVCIYIRMYVGKYVCSIMISCVLSGLVDFKMQSAIRVVFLKKVKKECKNKSWQSKVLKYLIFWDFGHVQRLYIFTFYFPFLILFKVFINLLWDIFSRIDKAYLSLLNTSTYLLTYLADTIDFQMCQDHQGCAHWRVNSF